MSNSNINKLAKYITHHVNNHGKYYGEFPISNGYVFTAPSITKDNIYFHLEKNNHTQRIYITFGKTNWADDGKVYGLLNDMKIHILSMKSLCYLQP